MKKKTCLTVAAALCMTLLLAPTTAFAEEPANADPIASIGDQRYTSLADAVAAVPTDGTKTTITLLKTTAGNGVVVKDGQNIVFDFGGYTYTIDPASGLVGSTGTETNGMQLRKGSKVTLKNGTLTSTTAKILVQNYCELTLEDVTLDGTKSAVCAYTVSNNCGFMRVTGDTDIIAGEGKVAFDLWYGMSSVYDEGVTVTFDEAFTGTVKGKIEYGAASRAGDDWSEKTALTIKGGTFETEFAPSNGNDITAANITVSGGTFDKEIPTEFCAEDFVPKKNSDGTYGVCNHEGTGTKTVDAKDATCSAKGYTGDTVCAACGTVLESGAEIPVNGNNHVFGEWKTVKEATATEKGLKERVCTLCGEKETAEIPMTANPNTGADGSLPLWTALTLILGAGACAAVSFSKKRTVRCMK